MQYKQIIIGSCTTESINHIASNNLQKYLLLTEYAMDDNIQAETPHTVIPAKVGISSTLVYFYEKPIVPQNKSPNNR